jgi:hypothetical protein
MKKWRHIKRYIDSLYYNHKVRGGNAWKAMWPLGQKFFKKLTHVTMLIQTSLVCAGIGLICTS